MITITRQEFKTDPDFKEVYNRLLADHKVAKHTETILRRNKHIKDFCEEARHYHIMLMKFNKRLYLHYDVSSWYNHQTGGTTVKIESFSVYDNETEYSIARHKGLSSREDSDWGEAGARLN